MQTRQFNETVIHPDTFSTHIERHKSLPLIEEVHKKLHTQMTISKNIEIEEIKDEFGKKKTKYKSQIGSLKSELHDTKIAQEERINSNRAKIEMLTEFVKRCGGENNQLSSKVQENIQKFHKMKSDMHNTVSRLDEEVKKSNIEIEKANKVVEHHNNLASRVYNKIMKTDETLDDKFNLELNLDDTKSVELIKVLKHIILPNLRKISILNSGANNEDTKHFIVDSFPDKAHIFSFSCYSDGHQKISNYMDLLQPCMQRIQDEITLVDSEINSKEFSQIIKASKNCKRFRITDCQLNLDSELDFGEDMDYSIENLYFRSSGKSNMSDWANNKSDLKSIISGISKSNLKDSRKEINVFNCSVSVEEVSQILKDHGIQNDIKITDNDVQPE